MILALKMKKIIKTIHELICDQDTPHISRNTIRLNHKTMNPTKRNWLDFSIKHKFVVLRGNLLTVWIVNNIHLLNEPRRKAKPRNQPPHSTERGIKLLLIQAS